MNMPDKKFILLPFVFFITFGVYLYSLMPSIGGGDTGELITAGYTLGIAHAPGYPLYVLSSKLFCTVMPWANPAYKMNLFSALCASGCVVIVCFILMKVMQQSLLPCVMAVFLGFIPGFWIAAHQAEVFALNGMAAAALIGIMMLSKNPSARVYDRLVVFLFGLSLGNQHTLLLLGPAIGVWIVWRMYRINYFARIRLLSTETLMLIFFFIAGFSIYAFLPVRSLVQPLLDWEDPETWSRFWFVVRRMRYGSFQLAQGNPAGLTISSAAGQVLFFGNLLFKSMGPLGTVILSGGIVVLIIKSRQIENAVLLCAFAVSGPGIFLLANVSPSAGTEYIMNRFMLLSLVPAVIIMGKGLSYWKQKNTIVLMLIPSILFCALIPGRIKAAVEKEIVRRDEYFVRDFGKNVLKHLPEGALLFSDRADELEFSLAYLLYAERERADVRFIDCNAGVSRSIYGTDYYRIWGKPRLRIREQVERKLIEQRDKPVLYGTMDTKQINIPMVSHGFLYNVPGTDGFAKPVLWDRFLIRERGAAVHDIRITHLHQNKLSLLAQYFLDNKLEHSAERAIEMLKANGGNKQWGMIAAYWYYERNMFLKAEQEYQHLLLPGDDPVVLLYLGVLYNKWGKFVRAEQILKKAVSLDQSESQAYYNLAVACWNLRRWKDSADAFAKTLALKPENTEAQKFFRLAEERSRRTK